MKIIGVKGASSTSAAPAAWSPGGTTALIRSPVIRLPTWSWVCR
jgi:hypothetical protein